MTGLRSSVLVAFAVLGQRNAPDRGAPAPVPREKIDAAIDRGATFLHETLRGRFENQLSVSDPVGESALALYTLLRCGIAHDDEIVERLIAVLASGPIHGTYEATCAIQALSAHDAITHRRWIEELAQKLVSWQLRDGDWAYPAGDANLSTTQYAALGLWTAARDGVPIAPEVWQRLATAVLDYQKRDGGFVYSRGARGPYGSMTAAGAGVLAIAEIELRTAGRWSDELGRDIVAGRERGQNWLAREFSVSTNPRGGGALFYYLYGLERLGALSGVAHLGDHDWYQEGASFLVAQQGLTGSWEGGELTDTCFALLFLRRATVVARSPVTGVSRPQAELRAPIRIASDGRGPVRIWIDGWNAAFRQQVEWPDEHGMGPRVTRVEYVVDQRIVAVELGDPDHPARAARFAIEHVFDRPGTQHVRARVFVRLPRDARGAEHALESQKLAVEVERAVAPEVPRGPNLLPAAKPKVQASSSASGPDAPLGMIVAPEYAVDGSVPTSWLAAADDERPTLSVTLSTSVDADVIRVSPAAAPLGVQYLSRPIEIEIEINGRTRRRLAMDPDTPHAMELVLEEPVAVKRLDLSILSIAKSERCPLVGIGEVELFRRER